MIDVTREPLHGTAIYNPHLLSKEELTQLFVVRRDLLDRLLESIAEIEEGKIPQHHLLLGARGMGKTMLLHRLRHAIEDKPGLREFWLPLTFPEEQYNISSLSELWLNCLDALSDSLESRGEEKRAEELDAAVEGLLGLPEAQRAREALALLTRSAAAIGQRLVLLIDNIDLIFTRIGDQGWELREVLSEEASLLLIGASAELMEATYEYDQPFYDFFAIHELRGLSLAETRELLLHYADLWDDEPVRQIAQDQEGRLKALHTLTGGNPRTLTILYNILARGLDGDVRSDLEALLDHHTPLYKARVEALPEQAQKVLHALAIHWHPASARQIADAARLEVNTVSSQLNRLTRMGYVEKVELPQNRTGFQVAERFFNIWYLMRATRRARRRLLWLVEFLRMIYSPVQLRDQATRHLRTLSDTRRGDSLRTAEFGFALAQAIDEPSLCNALETSALFRLVEDPDLEKRLGELIDFQSLGAGRTSQLEHKRRLEAAKKELLGSGVTVGDWSTDQLWQRLGGASLPLDLKEELARQMSRFTDQAKRSVRALLEELAEQLEQAVGASARDTLERAFRRGFLRGLEDADGAKDAAEALEVEELPEVASKASQESEFSPATETHLRELLGASPDLPAGWAYLGRKLAADTTRTAKAEAAFRRAIALEPRNTRHARFLGFLLLGDPKGHLEAEEALRAGLAGRPDDAEVWNAIGHLQARDPARLIEAESSYRKALDAQPDAGPAWYNLGNLLAQLPDRTTEAEDAFRKALEAKPDHASAWYNLGHLLAQLPDRTTEAEDAFRKALDAQPDLAPAWNNLGHLLAQLPDRTTEAENAFRKALEAQPDLAPAWYNLGHLLAQLPDRTTEAENAFRKALEAQPDLAPAWYNLGHLLAQLPDRTTEAENAYRKAIRLRSEPFFLNSLAWLLYENRRQLKEAEQLARAAVADADGDPYCAHTLATILIHRGAWAEAFDVAKSFLGSDQSAFLEQQWPEVLRFFSAAAVAGHAQEAAELLDETGLAQRLQPLREALAAWATDDRRRLLLLAPEVRKPTQEILEGFEAARAGTQEPKPSEPQRSESKARTSATSLSAAPSSKRS